MNLMSNYSLTLALKYSTCIELKNIRVAIHYMHYMYVLIKLVINYS